MSIIPLLASSIGRRDEVPNQELAASIVKQTNGIAVTELVSLLKSGTKDQQSDAIKVLYEIGEAAPGMVAPHIQSLLDLLTHKNNRLVWGAMTALHCLADTCPEALHKALPAIVAIGNSGSVITRDHAVGILIALCGHSNYAPDAFPLLNEQLLRAPVNQLPMYAEQALEKVPATYARTMISTLQSRLSDIDKESKRKRVEKVIRKLEKA